MNGLMLRTLRGAFAGAAAMLLSCAPAAAAGSFPASPSDPPSLTSGTQTAVLAGG